MSSKYGISASSSVVVGDGSGLSIGKACGAASRVSGSGSVCSVSCIVMKDKALKEVAKSSCWIMFLCTFTWRSLESA